MKNQKLKITIVCILFACISAVVFNSCQNCPKPKPPGPGLLPASSIKYDDAMRYIMNYDANNHVISPLAIRISKQDLLTAWEDQGDAIVIVKALDDQKNPIIIFSSNLKQDDQSNYKLSQQPYESYPCPPFCPPQGWAGKVAEMGTFKPPLCSDKTADPSDYPLAPYCMNDDGTLTFYPCPPFCGDSTSAAKYVQITGKPYPCPPFCNDSILKVNTINFGNMVFKKVGAPAVKSKGK